MSDLNVIICGKECSDCKFASINDRDVSRIIVHCAVRGKDYYYGQAIQCDDKEIEKK